MGDCLGGLPLFKRKMKQKENIPVKNKSELNTIWMIF